MNMHTRLAVRVLALACWMGAALGASASLITWEGAFNTTGDATLDVRTTGSTVEAVNMATTVMASVTLNGVTFSSGRTNSPLAAAASGMLSNGNAVVTGATYTNLLGTLSFGGGRTNTMIIGGGNLVPGYEYMVQLWFADNRALINRNNLGMEIGGAPSGNFVTLLSGSQGPQFGQYGVGTFVADGTSQTLYLETADNLSSPQMGNLHLNAYQIRLIAVPEPYALTLVLLGGALAFQLRRRAIPVD